MNDLNKRQGKFLSKAKVAENWNDLFNSIAKKEHIAAFKLRYLNNYTYEMIAKELDYANPASARRAVLKAYERIISVQQEDVEKARQQAIIRHKDLIHELYLDLNIDHFEIETKDGSTDSYVKKKCRKEKLQTIDRIIKLENQLAKLEGTIQDINQTNVQINNTQISSHEAALRELE